MGLTLQKIYEVNGQRGRLVRIYFNRAPHTRKGEMEYIFLTKNGKNIRTKDRNRIQELTKDEE